MILLILLVACDDKETNKPEETKEEEVTAPEEEEVKPEEEPDEESQIPEEDEEDQTTQKLTLHDVPPVPTDVEGLARQTPGPFAAAKNIYDLEAEIAEEFKVLGPMSDNPTPEEYELYFRYMYWLVAEDYINPEDTIKKWEFASFGNPDLPDAKFHFKENYNVEIILDASGSMAADAGGKTRMELAKEAIQEFLANVPEEAHVSLRVYGHKGTGADSDKELSCGAIEQVYGFSSYNDQEFQKALNQFQPSGWTPIADALKESEKALKPFDAENNTNLIYLVSDGIETCDGDPVAVAKSLADSHAKPIINIIGFQTDAEAQRQLEEMAEVSGGIFASAKNKDELEAEFARAEEVLEAWQEWKDDALSDVDAMRVDQSFDIMHVHNEWSFTTLGTSNNMASLEYVLEELDILTYNQIDEIRKLRRQTFDEIDYTVDELERTLEEISKQTIEEAKRTIEERFESGVEE